MFRYFAGCVVQGRTLPGAVFSVLSVARVSGRRAIRLAPGIRAFTVALHIRAIKPREEGGEARGQALHQRAVVEGLQTEADAPDDARTAMNEILEIHEPGRVAVLVETNHRGLLRMGPG